MPLVSQTIKNLKGGISQQPDILRFADQGELQVNGFSSEVKGLQKRPPSIHIKRLAAPQGSSWKPLIKLINRDAEERYYVVFTPSGQIQVYDLQGNQKTVNMSPSASSYITTTKPREDIRMVTIADYSFVVNRKKTVTMNTASGANLSFRTDGHALISVKGGQYGRTFKVYLNDSLIATHTTPDGSNASHAAQIDTQFLADKLRDLISTFFTTNSWTGWTVASGPSFVHIVAPSNASVGKLKLEDGFNNGLLTGVIFEAQRFNMLPAQAPDGYIARVVSDPGAGADAYYIKFDATKLVWRETARPGLLVNMNAETMPHVLVREASGTFTFRQADWEGRTAGDDDSNPVASFVDNTINDVFFFRNRLGLLSGESICLTKSGEFFNFYPKSVVAVSDTDPIDVSVSHNRVSILNHAVPFAEELLLWSDQTQFVLRADGILTSKSVKVDQATEFENTISARPVPAGRSVYFAAPRATYTSIRRYYAVQDVSAVKNAEDVSAHVPNYILNGVYSLGSSTTENVVTVLSEGSEGEVWLYKYLYLDEQLVQQSWSHWDFGSTSRVLACEFIGAMMYLIIDSPSGLFMEQIEFTQNTKDLAGEPSRLHMDRKVMTATDGYDIDRNITTVSLSRVYGAAPLHGNYWVVEQDGTAHFFLEPDDGWEHPANLEIRGKVDGAQVFVGEAYEFKYTFSKFLIKVEDGGGTRTEDSGRLQLRRAWVNYEESGPFTVSVCDKFYYGMSGKVLGKMRLGEDNVDTGQFRFPLMMNSRDCRVTIKSDTPNPVALIGAGWEANYFRRTQAI